jgi:hypothetical protein
MVQVRFSQNLPRGEDGFNGIGILMSSLVMPLQLFEHVAVMVPGLIGQHWSKSFMQYPGTPCGRG